MNTNPPPPRNLDLERGRIVGRIVTIEGHLRALGGLGGGTKLLLESLSGKLPETLERKIRSLAHLRNEVAHRDEFLKTLPQARVDRFHADSDEVIAALESEIARVTRARDAGNGRAEKLRDAAKARAAREPSPLDEVLAESKRKRLEEQFGCSLSLTEMRELEALAGPELSWKEMVPTTLATADKVSVGVVAAGVVVLGFAAVKLGLLDNILD